MFHYFLSYVFPTSRCDENIFLLINIVKYFYAKVLEQSTRITLYTIKIYDAFYLLIKRILTSVYNILCVSRAAVIDVKMCYDKRHTRLASTREYMGRIIFVSRLHIYLSPRYEECEFF